MIRHDAFKRPVKHGTVYGYVGRGCRCRPCTAAHSAYHRQRYRRRAEEAWAEKRRSG